MFKGRSGFVAGSLFRSSRRYPLSGRSKGLIHRSCVAGRFYRKFR